MSNGSPPPRTPRETVFRGYTQAELDIQYNQASLSPDLGPYTEFWVAKSEQARQALACDLDIAYGDTPIERLDIYRPETPRAEPLPVLFFLRGGAWRALSKDQAAFAAEMICGHGACFVTPDYVLAPDGSMTDIVTQVRRAFAWVWHHIRDHGGDPNRLYVAGHSSGGHLAATLLAHGWRADAGLPEDAIKGGVIFSGAYDLEPVQLSARNDYLSLTPEEVAAFSPNRHVPKNGPPLFVAFAEGDLHEFRRQGRAMADAWASAGNTVSIADVPDANHFDMADLFTDARSPHGGAVLGLLAGQGLPNS